MKRKFFTLCLLALSSATTLPIFGANAYGIPDDIQDGNILHCFDWTFLDIQNELPNIAAAGFGAIQVSPTQGNASTNAEWYYAYLPYDIAFRANGNGSKDQLRNLCSEAAKYGIKIIVDVVANHVNKSVGYHSTWWDTNDRIRWIGSVDYSSRYSITHGQLGDYGDINSELSEVQERAKAYVEDLKALGVSGIRWDAAKHIGLPSEGCDFWSVVTSVSGMWHYGEMLDTPGGDKYTLLKEYTNYIGVTDNEYSSWARSDVSKGSVPSGYGSWTTNSIPGNRIVYWGESHDEYAGDGKTTTYISQAVIDRAWAINACRANETALYFSRPSATDKSSIRLGQKGSTHFTSKEIAAVNHFRNAMVGKKDYYSSSNGIACITRENGGAVIVVGDGSSRSVSVPNGGSYAPVGTFKDEITGNTFTITSSTISGTVGDTGIAVIYDQDAQNIPSVTFSPDGGTFNTETLTITATMKNATSGWYRIGMGQQKSFTGTTTFTIGSGMNYNESVTVYWSATLDGVTATGSATYTKIDPNAAVYVYYNNPNNWSNVYCYCYANGGNDVVAAWPGEKMTYDSSLVINNKTGWYKYKIPDDYAQQCYILVNGGSGAGQYPAANEPGLEVSGSSMVLDGTTWSVGGPSNAVTGVELDNDEVSEYYNMQGVKVANPTHGIYIQKTGNKVKKVIINN
jgi:alpha-amylase